MHFHSIRIREIKFFYGNKPQKYIIWSSSAIDLDYLRFIGCVMSNLMHFLHYLWSRRNKKKLILTQIVVKILFIQLFIQKPHFSIIELYNRKCRSVYSVECADIESIQEEKKFSINKHLFMFIDQNSIYNFVMEVQTWIGRWEGNGKAGQEETKEEKRREIERKKRRKKKIRKKKIKR